MTNKLPTTLAQLSFVTLMAISAFIVLSKLDVWVGDWLGPLWIISGFIIPYFLGIGTAMLGWRFRSVWAGAISGLMVVLCPGTVYFLATRHLPTVEEIIGLWIPFLILATIQGSFTLPVGAKVRDSKRLKP